MLHNWLHPELGICCFYRIPLIPLKLQLILSPWKCTWHWDYPSGRNSPGPGTILLRTERCSRGSQRSCSSAPTFVCIPGIPWDPRPFPSRVLPEPWRCQNLDKAKRFQIRIRVELNRNYLVLHIKKKPNKKNPKTNQQKNPNQNKINF